MFNDQNKNFNPAKTQNDSIDVSSLPLRTMNDDLKNPDPEKINLLEEETNLPKKEVPEKQLTEKQKTSPFLSPTPALAPIQAPESNSQNQQAPQQTAVKISTKDQLKPIIKTKEKSEFDMKKVALFISAIFIILAGVATGAYFMFFSGQNNPANTQETPAEAIPNIQPENQTNTVDIMQETQNNPAVRNENTPPKEINIDKQNYLVINSQAKNKEAIQTVIKNELDKIREAKIYVPVEYVPVNDDFSPLTFGDFSQYTGLALPDSVKNNLGTSFSLFMNSTENGMIGIALVIDTKNSQQIKVDLEKEEKALTTAMSPLFLGATYQSKDVPFSTNTYKNIAIKYYNIQTGGTMAIDYAIINDNLLLATSKSIALNIVDLAEKINSGVDN